MNSADLIGKQPCSQVGEFGGAFPEHPQYRFAVASSQPEVVMQVVDRVAEVERERVCAVIVEEAGETGRGADAYLNPGKSHARLLTVVGRR